MKHPLNFLIGSACLACIASFASAQDHREAEIRSMEKMERESVLKSDSTALFDKIWSSTMIINTPANKVGTV
jgi:hypothetical protein